MNAVLLDNSLLLVSDEGLPTSVHLQAVPLALSQMAWDGQADTAALEVLPAGHAAGVYHISAPIIVHDPAPAAGIVDRIITFNAPVEGETTATNPDSISVQLAGLAAGQVVPIVSDGSAAVTVLYHPSGVSPGAVLDVYAAAELIGRLP